MKNINKYFSRIFYILYKLSPFAYWNISLIINWDRDGNFTTIKTLQTNANLKIKYLIKIRW